MIALAVAACTHLCPCLEPGWRVRELQVQAQGLCGREPCSGLASVMPTVGSTPKSKRNVCWQARLL